MMEAPEIRSRPLPIRLSFYFSLLIACLVVEPAHGAPKEPAGISKSAQAVYFGTDVVPMLTKLGCNSGGCHGKATGQNGFKLSLFGFEPELDYEAIVKESRGRRLSFAAPENSLLLTKATAVVDVVLKKTVTIIASSTIGSVVEQSHLATMIRGYFVLKFHHRSKLFRQTLSSNCR
jgi:hypothetical protein